MAKTNYYILLNKNLNMIHTDCKLPIYWNKEVAMRDKEKFGAFLCKEIQIKDVKNMVNLQFYENFYEMKASDKNKIISLSEIDLEAGYEANLLIKKAEKLINAKKNKLKNK